MSEPRLSVVIASCVGDPYISRCLRSLEAQRDEGVEFIVVDRAGGEVAEMIERDFPWIELIRRPEGQSVPDLRRGGLDACNAEYVGIIRNDHAFPRCSGAGRNVTTAGSFSNVSAVATSLPLGSQTTSFACSAT